MNEPTPEEVRTRLATLDARDQKIVAGLLGVMMKEPARVREREWIAEKLTQVTIMAGEFEADSPQAGVQAVHAFLETRAAELLSATYLLFQRVGLDLAARAQAGFTFDEALRCGLAYMPSFQAPLTDEPAHDLGQQPLARLMAERDLRPKDLVAASQEQVTHKMVSRAMKGRRLTANTMGKVHRAWNRAAGSEHRRDELFNYEP